MCGECFLLFPSTEDFSAHQCQVVTEVDKVENGSTVVAEVNQPTTSNLDVPQSTECVHIGKVRELLSFSPKLVCYALLIRIR